MASSKRDINREIFEATFRKMGQNEKETKDILQRLDKAREDFIKANRELDSSELDWDSEGYKKLESKSENAGKALKALKFTFANLGNAFAGSWRPEKDEPTRGGAIGKAIQRALQKLDNICTITGDASLQLQVEKFKIEARLADPDHKGLKRFGDLLLKVVLSVAKFVTDAAVKIKAYVHNTEGYRDEVNAGIKAKFSRKGGNPDRLLG